MSRKYGPSWTTLLKNLDHFYTNYSISYTNYSISYTVSPNTTADYSLLWPSLGTSKKKPKIELSLEKGVKVND